ncbi:HIT family protein [Pleomorphomonas carboxyditropha]|uniref:HIT family protein n=1 Tax=Pleomorphomonas carboxyditropha TaxID=2023338 RepID=UPI0013FDD47B|nr:HIT family protein [Pleomorphomonas carboxyditropha]
MSQDCIFCRIASKRSRAYIVDESENFICFFPEKPDLYGHTLIASKKHYKDIRDAPPELGSELFKAAQKLFNRYSDRLGATGFNLLSANGKAAEQSIDHLHFHFFPRFSNDGLTTWPQLPPFEPNLNALFRLVNAGENDES